LQVSALSGYETTRYNLNNRLIFIKNSKVLQRMKHDTEVLEIIQQPGGAK
jgi:hypothetical protein